MVRLLLIFSFLLSLGVSLLFATADGPDALQTRDLKEGELLCIYKEHNVSSPAVGCLPAGTRCLVNLGYYPQAGDAPPPEGTIVWVKIQDKEHNVTGWSMAKWLGEDSNCSIGKH